MNMYATAHATAGFSITLEELRSYILTYITTNSVLGWANLGPTINALKGTPELRWASPLDVKTAVDAVFLDTFGPKEATKPKAKVR